MEGFLATFLGEDSTRRTLLCLNHEQPHQELALTDIKHAFFSNPLRPSYAAPPLSEERHAPAPKLRWHSFNGGLIEIGYPLQAADHLDFMSDDAYTRSEFWLSEGWETLKRTGWQAPLYWERDASDATGWRVFTLRGWCGLGELLDTPVCHISLFEADAFARWRACRLPTEAEWECVASQAPPHGNLLDSERLHPAVASGAGVDQLFGDCWEWTASAYTGYPGYKPLPDALREYNGKFMSGQMVLRGGSCVTPVNHVRATYRNFLAPATRWQFTGIRLAS